MICAVLAITAGIHSNVRADEAASNRRAENASIYVFGERLPLTIRRKIKTIVLFVRRYFERVTIDRQRLRCDDFIFSMRTLDETDDIFVFVHDNKTKMKIVVLDEDKPRALTGLRRELELGLGGEIDMLLPAPHKTGIGMLRNLLRAQFQTQETFAFSE